jgi:transposase
MHACDDRTCVNPEHLSTGTVKDNSQDMRQKGRAPHGTRQPNSKLTEETVAAIKGEYIPERYGELVRLANKYMVNMYTIHNIVSGRTWKHVAVELGSMPTNDAPHVRPTRGSAHQNAKLDEEKVVAIRRARKEGVTVKALAEKYGVSLATIETAVNGKLWGHVPFETSPVPSSPPEERGPGATGRRSPGGILQESTWALNEHA